MATGLISQGEVEWITQGVACNCRNDGRGREDFRELSVQLGVVPQASGSARVRLGETDVIVGIKVCCGGKSGLCVGLRRRRRRRCRRRAALGILPPLTTCRCRLHCMQTELGTPHPDRPDCGVLNVAVECSPVASPAFRVRAGGVQGVSRVNEVKAVCYGGDGCGCGGTNSSKYQLHNSLCVTWGKAGGLSACSS